MVDRVHAELTEEETARIVNAYHSWRGDPGSRSFKDMPGFARWATLEEIRYHRYALVPGRYVGFGQRPSLTWERSELAQEVAEMKSRLNQVAGASESAMAILSELLNG